MGNSTNKITRKNSPPIKVYCLPEERELIESLSAQAGLSTSTYLREVGQGYRIQGVTDVEQVRELVRVNGDLGRLGGLLKLWLSNDAKVANVGVNTILAVLNRIEATQDQMSSLMESIIRPRRTNDRQACTNALSGEI
ncbi:conjugal transfer transcriptional regulator TraJ [Vibrio parahaemolyticus]|nr:conjugal transfer transcriptional regulator TraJ [Vibrio parahaemolyticus]